MLKSFVKHARFNKALITVRFQFLLNLRKVLSKLNFQTGSYRETSFCLTGAMTSKATNPLRGRLNAAGTKRVGYN
jgi:hypothetical protein